MTEEITIPQNHYGKLVIDFSEKNIVQVWNHQTNPEPEVIQIERDNLPAFLSALASEQLTAAEARIKELEEGLRNAQADLKSCYKRLGFKGGNVIDLIDQLLNK